MSNQLSGDIIFADQVLRYAPGNPTPTNPNAQIPDHALGTDLILSSLVFSPSTKQNNKFDDLMSVSTPPGQHAVVSKVTLGAFEDLGFDVDMTQASETLKVFAGSVFQDNP